MGQDEVHAELTSITPLIRSKRVDRASPYPLLPCFLNFNSTSNANPVEMMRIVKPSKPLLRCRNELISCVVLSKT